MGLSTQKLKGLVLAVSTEIDMGALTADRLGTLMRARFGGTDAAGAWSWRMAYDVMEAGFVRSVMDRAGESDPTNELRRLVQLAQGLPTQTRRSEAQLRLQQFSTPLAYAHLAAQAAMLGKGDHVLEPSAGTGSMALFARQSGASLSINEIDPFRASLLGINFDTHPSAHDGEHIDDLLSGDVRPSVILMNPPFSSSAKRSGDPTIAARHLVSATKRLVRGGRIVAIMPAGFTGNAQHAWFQRFSKLAAIRSIITLPGQVYRKMGTSVDTKLIIADKVEGETAFELHEASSLDEALAIVQRDVPTRSRVTSSTPRIALSRAPVASAGQMKPAKAASASSTASAKPTSTGIAPVAYTVLATPRCGDAISEIYASYRPQVIDIVGAQPHPTPLVESLAMSSVVPPAPSVNLDLPSKIVTDGLLSETQLETVLMAANAHACDLPGRFVADEETGQLRRVDDDPDAKAFRQGSYIADGTGVGKGREASAIILSAWLDGQRKAIWLSKSATLIEDAIRDWRDLGGAPTDIQSLSKWKPDAPITMGAGILFVTYATLRSQGKGGTTRLQQILDWVGEDFSGVIAFDEAHAMANAIGSTEGRGTKPSQQGIAGLRLQNALPRARIVYVSATGATEVSNLAYAGRLGLWGSGPDYPFASREQFISSMEAGGVAAMEIVARDLKAMGLYTARALSFEGVEYDILEHGLSEEQVEVYDTYATAFKTIHTNLHKALEATGIVDPDGATQSTGSKASAMSRFESTKQRFFSHLLLGIKAPAVIKAVERDVSDGWAPVIQIVSTGEALLKRRVDAMELDDVLVEGALTPREYVIAYLENAFPIHAQELIEIEGETIAQPLRDADDNLVVSQEALALRDAVIEDLMCLAPVPSALDQILWHFGEETVAEVTGRSIRPLRDIDGNLAIHKRSASSNSSETAAFMAGEKDILIFSDAGGTGRSYHAAQSAQNQKRRRHYLLEPGWRADNAIQGLGRTHRSAQVSAPWFRVCTTNVHGEKRFTATISARLSTLGALSRGQRETGSQGLFRPEDDLMSSLARSALRGLYADLAHDRAKSMRYHTFTEWTGLRLMDGEGVLLEELPPIQRFLNRVLALPIEMQNALFGEFMDRIALQTERAREAGTLDQGLETLRGEKIEQVSCEDLWTCPKTKAVTRIVGLDVTNPIDIPCAAQIIWSHKSDRSFMINRASGNVGLISKRPIQVYDEDEVVHMRRIARPRGHTMITEAKFANSAWEPITKTEFVTLWDREADGLPKIETTRMFLLTGLLLPIWMQIPSQNERIYRVTPEGGVAMIGRALSEDHAAVVRARFMTDTPVNPEDILTKIMGTTAKVDLGKGLSLQRRRVAGAMRFEIDGADRSMIAHLKTLGCFTEIIAFQLRLFLPNGEGVDTAAIIARITGDAATEDEKAA